MATGQTNGKVGHESGQRLAKQLGQELANGQAGQDFGHWPTPEELARGLANEIGQVASGQLGQRRNLATVLIALANLATWALIVAAFLYLGISALTGR